MRERDAGNTEEISGIRWPSGNLPPDIMANIVHASQSRPLREILPRQIIFEGDQLWARIKPPGCDSAPGDHNFMYVIVIEQGYSRLATQLLKACDYFNDCESAVKIRVKRLELAFSQPLPEFQEYLTREMSRAIKSLSLDPTGLSWLNEEREIQEGIWGTIHERYGRKMYTTNENPGVVGFREGVRRYRELYRQAEREGARSDRINGWKQFLARAKKTFRH